MSEIPHSIKKSPLPNSAAPTTGILIVMTLSVSGPTDMSLSKYQNLTLLYDTVPFLCQVRFSFFSTSLEKSFLSLTRHTNHTPESVGTPLFYNRLFMTIKQLPRADQVKEVKFCVNWHGGFNPSIVCSCALFYHKLLKVSEVLTNTTMLHCT
jgi:hypothetical protein